MKKFKTAILFICRCFKVFGWFIRVMLRSKKKNELEIIALRKQLALKQEILKRNLSNANQPLEGVELLETTEDFKKAIIKYLKH
jgi:hypothetical protein